MGTSLKGTIVIINFPFSDLSAVKKLPALVIADWGSDDVILAQITSIANKDVYAIELNSENFSSGSLMKTSFIRPNKLFTADKRMFLQIVGKLTDKKIKEVMIRLRNFSNPKSNTKKFFTIDV
jgi:mRNA interferase MazF